MSVNPQDLSEAKTSFPGEVLLVVDKLLLNSAYDFQKNGQVQISKKHIKAGLASLGIKNPPEWFYDFEKQYDATGWKVTWDDSEPKDPVYIFTPKK